MIRRIQQRRFTHHHSLIFGEFARDSATNLSLSILQKAERKLHLLPNHPLQILKRIIEGHLKEYKVISGRNAGAGLYEPSSVSL
jgi:hypothetical protein